MDAVTYPNEKVIDFINRNLTAVRVPITSKPLPREFNATWTPTFVILDPRGQEHHRSVGYLPPEEFIPMLLVGIGKSFFDRELYSEADKYFARVVDEYPKSDAAPQAIYYRGVGHYKTTHDARDLKRIHETLSRNYKNSEWAKRASVYERL